MERLKDLNSLFYLYPFPSWVYDADNYKILFVNKPACQLYGYPEDEFLCLTLHDLWDGQVMPNVLSALADIHRENENIDFGRAVHKTKNGKKLTVQINGHPLRLTDTVSMLMLCRDVTAEEEQETLAKETAQRLRAATSIANLGYWRLELDRNTLSWTDEVYKIWNRIPGEFELNFETFMATLHPDEKEDFDRVQQACFLEDKKLDYIHRILLPDNSIKWVHELGRLVKNDEGTPIAFEGAVQDITARKEEELRQTLLETFVTHTTDVVLITEVMPLHDPGPRIIYVNEAFTALTGYTAGEVIGKTPRILQGPNTDRAQLDLLKHALHNNESCEVTVINYSKNGDEYWTHLSIAPVCNEAGTATHFIAIQRDVTEQKNKELEKELLSDISASFKSANTYNTAASEVCKTLRQFGQFDFVEIWSANIEKTQLNLMCHHTALPGDEIFYKYGPDSFLLNEGLAGKVWYQKEQILWNDIGDHKDFVRRDAAAQLGLQSVLGIPLLFNNEVVGVAVVGSRKQAGKLIKYTQLFLRLQQFLGSEMSRKKLEEELGHLYGAIPDIVCLVDLEGRFVKINEAGCKMLGYPEDEILYHTCAQFVHPQDKHISLDALHRLAQEDAVIKFENRYYTKTGELIWLSWMTKSVAERGLIYATAKNITEEKNLRELNRQATQLAKIGSWNIDLLKEELYWSEVVHHLHETDGETFIPDLASGIEFYRADFREIVQASIQQCINHAEPFDFEAIVVTANKRERWVRVIGNAEVADGKCRSIFGSFQDIHDRKEAEGRLQSLADNLPGVVFQYIIHPDGTDALQFVTKGATGIWGYSAEAVMQNNQLVWDKIKEAGELAKVQETIVEAITEKKKWTVRFRYRMPDGEMRTHAGYGSPHFLTDGTTIFNSVILDVTQQAKNEELLEQSTLMAKIGSWELDLLNNTGEAMYWSPMTRLILECGENYNPTLTGGFEFYTEASKQRIQQVVDVLIREGEEFDEELLLITTTKKEKWIRCIGKSERINNKCSKIYGSFQDIHASKILDLQIREILGSISDAFYAVNNKWEFTYFNKEAERLLLRSEQEVLGRNIWEVFPQAVATPLQELYQRVAATGKSESFEYLFPGDGKWYEVNAYPSSDGISSYFKNTDERKRSAEELIRADEEKKRILESIGDAFFAVDTAWTITYWNKEAEKLLGRNREEVLGTHLWESYPDAVDTDFYRYYHKAVETRNTVSFEEFYPALQKWFEVSAYPSQEGLSVYFKDVTLRKMADINLLQANERFEKVTEATNDVIWDWDIVQKTFYRSNGIGRLFGETTPKALEEKDFWQDSFHPDDLPKIQQTVADALADATCSHWECGYRIFNEDQEMLYVIDRGVIIRDEQGTAVRMVGAMTDVTERKRMELQLSELNQSLSNYAYELERSNEELEQFAFITSHDLQEPLRMISSFMDLLKRRYGGQLDEKAHQYIHFATDGAKRMKQIILELLEYSRAGSLDEGLDEVDINLLLAHYLDLRRTLIAEKEAVIVAGQLPVIKTKQAALMQVFHCLLDNAIKYSRPSVAPRVELAAEQKDNAWVFSIKDNGIGIDPKFFEKIFIIFQRLHNRDDYAGTGIGLSIAKRHVDYLKGRIWLTSAPGEGSTFYFSIPIGN